MLPHRQQSKPGETSGNGYIHPSHIVSHQPGVKSMSLLKEERIATRLRGGGISSCLLCCCCVYLCLESWELCDEP
ncbi:hypothetical protein PIIN_06015 [Serendipita indica DSM 11827]|uniref:Uncharacterized protein n=1 Tax=Serendipita indica (strain DSM 11827) TaxID=1109443 RepID=G4TL86_SERID|nr:hypothetical protein PIIN_06015 [Serendipita indica DSM 11827]